MHRFFAETVSAFGLPVGPFAIVLPLGISFFTFHHVMHPVHLRVQVANRTRYAMYIASSCRRSRACSRLLETMTKPAASTPGWQRQFALGVMFIADRASREALLGI